MGGFGGDGRVGRDRRNLSLGFRDVANRGGRVRNSGRSAVLLGSPRRSLSPLPCRRLSLHFDPFDQSDPVEVAPDEVVVPPASLAVLDAVETPNIELT